MKWILVRLGALFMALANLAGAALMLFTASFLSIGWSVMFLAPLALFVYGAITGQMPITAMLFALFLLALEPYVMFNLGMLDTLTAFVLGTFLEILNCLERFAKYAARVVTG